MKKTGELLKQKRESANLSLSEVALATKINPKILTAIENGDEAALPAKTFLKGFVRSYALFLKMDLDEVMRLYHDETGATQPVIHEAYRQPEPTATPTQRRRPPEESSSGLRTAAVIVIVVLIGLIIGVRELIEKYQKEKVVAAGEVKVSPLSTPPVLPQPTPPPTPGTAAAATAVSTPPPEAKPPEAKPQEAKVEEAVVAAPAPAPAPEPPAQVGIPHVLEAPKGAAKEVHKDEPKPAEAAVEKKEVKSEEKPAEAEAKKADNGEKPAPALTGLKNEIILEALDKVDVNIQVHGETKRVSLAPTQVHTIRADGPLVLDISDGGAVNIILNGRERGVPGDLGKPKQVKIP